MRRPLLLLLICAFGCPPPPVGASNMNCMHDADNSSDAWSVISAMRSGDPSMPSKPSHAEQEPLTQQARFHWAILACDARHGWASTLSSTLLSAWANGVQQLTTTVIFCKPFNASAVPSLFNNLRFAARFKVIYMPESLACHHRPSMAMLLALNVPAYWGAAHEPLLITEEDVAFATEFNDHLLQATTAIESSLVADGPMPDGSLRYYFFNLYSPGPVQSVEQYRTFQTHEHKQPHQPAADTLAIGGEIGSIYSYGAQVMGGPHGS